MDMHNARNLTTAMLAFQAGMINRDQMLRAIRLWISDKRRNLCDILVEQSAIDSNSRDLLVALVAKHEEIHRDQPNRSMEVLSSIDSSLTKSLHALEDSDIEDVIAATARMNEPTHNPDEVSALRRTNPSHSDRGRFSVIRPHAKGGLGEVFVAFDHELNRQVALKEIQGKHSFDQASRMRFVQEAEITGGLEHPGIVPVYGLGTYDDGRPFYAMRFIKGMSLAEASHDFHGKHSPTTQADYRGMEFRKLLQRLIDVCFSIEYAHSRGVLHRDLKPGNIMLGKYGETLVVDWGLAKAIGRNTGSSEFPDEETLRPSSGNDSSNTRLGQAVGTPAYMSPEAAAGNLLEVGVPSDVYCLGSTLYHLLTARPPYQRSELNDPEIIKAGKFPKPREINSAIPKSLEAIALKAMRLRVTDRYPSAKALADDLELWLADEPITAYQEPPSVRATRFIRRHKTLVTSLAAIALLLLVGITAYSALLASKNRELEVANKEIENQRARALENAETAVDIADSMLEVAEKQISNIPGLASFRLELTERIYKLSTDASKLEPDNRRVEMQLAKSGRYLGNLVGKIGDRERMMRLFDESIRIQLKAASSDQPGLDLLAGTYRDLGSFLKSDGKLRAASEAYLKADEVLSQMIRDFPNNPNNKRSVGPIAIERIGIYMDLLNYEAALASAIQCEQLYVGLAESESPDELDYAIAMLANSRHLQMLARLGRIDEARQVFIDGTKRGTPWLERSVSIQVRLAYPRTLLFFADELSKQESFPDDLDAIIAEAIKRYENIVASIASPTYKYYLASCFRVKATIDAAHGKFEDADSAIARSIADFTALVAADKKYAYYSALAESHYVNAKMLQNRGDEAGYKSHLTEAVNQQRLATEAGSESLYERQRLINYEKEFAVFN
jgi:serine/threonine-protein kinase